MLSYNKYDNAFGNKPIEESINSKLGNEIVKIDGNSLITSNTSVLRVYGNF